MCVQTRLGSGCAVDAHGRASGISDARMERRHGHTHAGDDDAQVAMRVAAVRERVLLMHGNLNLPNVYFCLSESQEQFESKPSDKKQRDPNARSVVCFVFRNPCDK